MPEYLKHFPNIYLSPPLAAEKLGKGWPAALEEIGRLNGVDLVLPAPTRRTIRLLYPDGKPLAGVDVPISLYGSSENHCGVAVGIELGVFTTSAAGEVAVIAPNSSLALSIGYFEEEPDGPAGKAFSASPDVIVGGEPMITLKRLWTLPEHDYVIRLQTAASQPIAHAHLTACYEFRRLRSWMWTNPSTRIRRHGDNPFPRGRLAGDAQHYRRQGGGEGQEKSD